MKDMENQKKNQKLHYQNNKELYRQRASRTRENRRKYVQAIKETTPCADCNTIFPYYVMDFDHRGEQEKEDNVSRLMSRASIRRIQAEIDKCDLVCANCHRVRTHKRQNGISITSR